MRSQTRPQIRWYSQRWWFGLEGVFGPYRLTLKTLSSLIEKVENGVGLERGYLIQRLKATYSAEAMRVDYGAASGAVGPWST